MATLVFDYDGTLHDSIKIYAPAFRLAYNYLVSHGLMPDRTWSDQEISIWLGYTSKDMWNSFPKSISQETKDLCSQMIGEEMLHLINSGKAQLYPGIFEMLKRLKADGHTLIFLSNCKHNYMIASCKYFELERYFSAFYCGEDFDWIPKYKIFNQIKKEYSGEFVIIGDRLHDLEISQKHGLKFIGCVYGYGQPGELSRAQFIAHNPLEICKVQMTL